MSDKQSNYDHLITINTDQEPIKLRVNEIDLDLFKAVRPLLKNDNTEGALIMLKSTVIQEDKEVYQSLLDGRKLKVFIALENAFAELIGGYSVEVKKK